MVSALFASALVFTVAPVKADWLCGDDVCRWVNYDVVEPAFAVAWPAPIYPHCYWKQGIFGRWKYICPGR
jgi:hypothetical protein